MANMFLAKSSKNTVGTDVLKQEHQVILKALKILDALCNRLSSGGIVPSEHLQIIMTFILEYADGYHHGKEEDILLPFLDKVGLPKEAGPITEILDEHLLQRGYVEAMCDALSHTYALKDISATQKFIVQARNLIGLLSEHIFKEDSILLPQADRLFSAEHQRELFEAFQKAETASNLVGRMEGLVEKIQSLEGVYLNSLKAGCCGCGGHG